MTRLKIYKWPGNLVSLKFTSWIFYCYNTSYNCNFNTLKAGRVFFSHSIIVMLDHCSSPFLPVWEQLSPKIGIFISGFHTNLDAGAVFAVVEVVDVVDATVWGADCCWSGWVVVLGWVGTADGEEEDHGLGRGEVFSVPCWGFAFGFDPGPVPKHYTKYID